MTGFIGGVSVVVLLWIAVSAEPGGSGAPADTPADGSSTQDRAEYGLGNLSCPNFDLNPYVDAIGMTPDVHQSDGGSGEPAELSCLFESSDSTKPIRVHHLDIYAEISSSAGDAEASYQQFLAGTQLDPSEMRSLGRRWDQSVMYEKDDRLMSIVQDSNVVITVGQSFSPNDALKPDEATELMVTYVDQVLEELHR